MRIFENMILNDFGTLIGMLRPKRREIIDVDYIEITDEGEIHHAISQKLIENGTERLHDGGTKG